MARRKNKPESVEEKNVLAERLRAIRVELFGERGGSEMARRLTLPVRTWYNYESGVTVPAEIILRFIELTCVEPVWLLHGTGARFRAFSESAGSAGSNSVRELLCIALERLEQQRDIATESAQGSRVRSLVSASRQTNQSGPFTAVSPIPAHAEGQSATGLRAASALPHSDVFQRLPGSGTSQAYQSVQVVGDAMAPVLADGSVVLYSEHEDPPQRLAGQLVVAWVDDQPHVRWFDLLGSQGILRAEKPGSDLQSLKINLQTDDLIKYKLRRVVGTRPPHA